MAKISVKAAPGLRFPMERSVRKYITADTVVEVDSTAYYRRAVADGDLIRVIGKGALASASAAQEKHTKKAQPDE